MTDRPHQEGELRKRCDAITGPCDCGEAYTTRNLIDHRCAWHSYADEIFDLVQAERDAETRACAEICDQFQAVEYPSDEIKEAIEQRIAQREGKL